MCAFTRGDGRLYPGVAVNERDTVSGDFDQVHIGGRLAALVIGCNCESSCAGECGCDATWFERVDEREEWDE